MKTGEHNLVEAISQFLLAESICRPDEIIDATESPIEALLYKAILMAGMLQATFLNVRSRETESVFDLSMLTQQSVEGYRVDFMFLAKTVKGRIGRLAVECDGHAYHERTKEQAAKDRARDRRLQELGFTVYRFTGSEIYRDAFKCARQICNWAEDHHFADGFE